MFFFFPDPVKSKPNMSRQTRISVLFVGSLIECVMSQTEGKLSSLPN